MYGSLVRVKKKKINIKCPYTTAAIVYHIHNVHDRCAIHQTNDIFEFTGERVAVFQSDHFVDDRLDRYRKKNVPTYNVIVYTNT